MKSDKKLKIIRLFLLIIIVICLICIADTHYRTVKHRKQQEKLIAMLNTEDMIQSAQEIVKNVTKEDEVSSKLEELYAINNDLTGWLSIEGTEIDYPVLQNEDDDYYLSHNFYGEKDKYGSLFVRSRADVDTPGTNIIIYGHSMKDGSMFGSLDDYKSEKFYKEHPVISFDTLYETRSYEVMAVFPSKVYGEDEDVFKYYQFYQADTEEEFLDFYENVKRLSLYDTEVTAEFGDTFITLSTCAYHVEDGRFVVVAKRLIDNS